MFKVVILDVDDTLCLTEEAAFRLENEVAEGMGFEKMSRKTHLNNWGVPIREAISLRIPGIDVEEFVKREEVLVVEYVQKGHLDAIPSENLQALDKLREAGIRLAIVTSRSFAEAKNLLHEKHPLSEKIEKFYHRDNSDYLKPDPRVFNQALSHFKVKPKECVYLGDAINDAIAANGAGVHFIAVLESGLKTRKDFKDQNVDFFANKFIDATDYILSH